MQKNSYHKNISCTYCDDPPELENINNTSQPISGGRKGESNADAP